jgi:hypothetical protein
MNSILELLKASIIDLETNSIKLPAGFTPNLYGTARECLALCGARFDPKTQTHQFDAETKAADGLAKCLKFVADMDEKNEQAAALRTPATSSRLTGLLITDNKYEIWLGDTIIGTILMAGNVWRARYNNEQIARCETRVNAVRAVLGAARVDLEAEGITAIQWTDNNILEPLISEVTAQVDELPAPESKPVHSEPSSSTEETSPVNDSRPAAPEPVTGIRMIPLDQVIADDSVQSRAQLDMIAVAEYAEVLQTSESLPPIKVVSDGSSNWVRDGFHRVAAHKSAGRTEINCEVSVGSKRDAILASAGSNKDHGLRRTNADKRRSVEMVLRDNEGRQWSDRRIAEHVGVDGKTVATMRNDLEFAGEIATQSVRKSAAGKPVTAKKNTPVEPSPSLNLGPSSTPAPSLEHGGTRKAEITIFKRALVELQTHLSMWMVTTLDPSTHHGFVGFNMAGRAFYCVGNDLTHVMAAQNDLNAVVYELLGRNGAQFDPKFEILWRDVDGPCDMPKPPEKEIEVRPLWPDLETLQASGVPAKTPYVPDLEPVPGLFTHLESLLELGDGAIITISREAGLWLAVSVSPVAAPNSKALPFKAITVKGTGLELDAELMTAILPFSPEDIEALEAAKPERPATAIKPTKPAATATKPTPAKPAKKGK